MKTRTLWVISALLLMAQIGFIAAYLQAESTVFYWDHSMYPAFARHLFAANQQSFLDGLKLLHYSFTQNYSYLFAVPAQVGYWLFGETRSVYILSNFFSWGLLFNASVVFALRRGFSFPLPLACVSSFGFSLLVPILWVPLLQGYPDIGAAAALVFALGLLGKTSRKFSEALWLGAALTTSVLFRRHFAYGALSLVFVFGVFDLSALWRLPTKARGAFFKRLLMFYGTAGAAALALLLLIATEFVKSALTINYNELYDSYRKPPLEFMAYALKSFGVFPALASLGGLLYLSFKKNVFAAALLSWCALWLVLWCNGPVEIGPHYLQQVLATGAVFGLAAWVKAAQNRPSLDLALVIGGIVLVGNSLWVLALAPSDVHPNRDQAPRFFAAPHAPTRRNDLYELVRLAKTIRESVKETDSIAVLGSSFVFNQDLLRALYTDVLKDYSVLMLSLQVPEVDTVQEPPYDLIAAPTVFVVPDPAQFHLDPKKQKTHGSLAALFPPKGELASYLIPDPDSFVLEDGVTVRLWRRRGEIPPALLYRLIQEMDLFLDNKKEAYAPSRRPWVLTRLALKGMAAITEGGVLQTQGWFNPHHNSQTFFYTRPLEKGSYRLRSHLISSSPDCRAGFGEWRVKDAFGKTLVSNSFTQENSGAFEQTLSVPALKGDAFLEITLGVVFSGIVLQPCSIVTNGLNLVKTD